MCYSNQDSACISPPEPCCPADGSAPGVKTVSLDPQKKGCPSQCASSCPSINYCVPYGPTYNDKITTQVLCTSLFLQNGNTLDSILTMLRLRVGQPQPYLINVIKIYLLIVISKNAPCLKTHAGVGYTNYCILLRPFYTFNIFASHTGLCVALWHPHCTGQQDR